MSVVYTISEFCTGGHNFLLQHSRLWNPAGLSVTVLEGTFHSLGNSTGSVLLESFGISEVKGMDTSAHELA
jgi:hypothetical protein